jgi:hypothetical protein
VVDGLGTCEGKKLKQEIIQNGKYHQVSDAIICSALNQNEQSAHHEGRKRGMCYLRHKIQQKSKVDQKGFSFEVEKRSPSLRAAAHTNFKYLRQPKRGQMLVM